MHPLIHLTVPGFPGYTVTPSGTVWSWWQRNGSLPATISAYPLRRLSPGIAGSNGYEQVWLYRAGQRFGRFVHLLVLDVFAGPRPDGTQARHIDGNERNNAAENLAWGTPVQNAADRDRHGTTARGEKVGTSVATVAMVAGIRSAHVDGESVRSMARRLPLSRRQIGRIVRGDAWGHIR
jgi:hypothetical protein